VRVVVVAVYVGGGYLWFEVKLVLIGGDDRWSWLVAILMVVVGNCARKPNTSSIAC
jgi:hypothetical protein